MNYEMILTSGKKVVVREPTIKDHDTAALSVGGKAGDSNMTFAMLVQSELVKNLLVSVNGNILSGKEKETLDKHFEYKEYAELLLGVKEILGEAKKPQISLVKGNSGDK